MMKQKLFFLLVCLVCTLTLITGCSTPGEGEGSNGSSTVKGGDFTITLNGTEITTDSKDAIVEDSKITIVSGGNYNVSGKLTDGQIIVNVDKEVNINLILNNVDITCSNSAPIYIIEANDAIITLADGTTNTLTDGDKYTYLNAGDNEPDATIFSKADLTIEGGGSLTVKANFNDGIASRDDLIIESTTITVDAKTHGIKGKDQLTINNSTINVTAGDDGIKSTNDKDAGRGYMVLNNNTMTITAVDEAISAIDNITITDGTITIDTRNNAIKSLKTIDIQSGTLDIKTLDDDFIAEKVTGTDKAVVTVNGSTYNFQ
jgi:hypothetical protein